MSSDSDILNDLLEHVRRARRHFATHERASYVSRIAPLLDRAVRDVERTLPALVSEKDPKPQGGLFVGAEDIDDVEVTLSSDDTDAEE